MGLSPEEIRHVSIKRRFRGYDRRATEQLLAEITESFEAVWHQRTRLHDQVKRLQAEAEEADRRRQRQEAKVADLQERLQHKDEAFADVRKAAAQLEAGRGTLLAESERAQAEVAHLRATIERLEEERTKGHREQERLQAEGNRFREEAERLRTERGGQFEEARHSSEEVAKLRDDVRRLEAERTHLAEEAQRLAANLDELHDEVTRLEADRSRLLQDSARRRAESVELQNADRSRNAELAELRQELQKLEDDQAALRLQLEETEAELGMHPRVARRLRELEDTARARYRELFSSTPARPSQEQDGERLPSAPDRAEEREDEPAHRDPQLLTDLTPEATARDREGSASEPVDGGAADSKA